jgi:hypothetical protein
MNKTTRDIIDKIKKLGRSSNNKNKLDLILSILDSKNSEKSIFQVINVPDGFELAKVAGDGKCFYHSIVQSAKFNNNYNGIINTFNSGEDLKNYIINFLLSVKKNVKIIYSNIITNDLNTRTILKESKVEQFKNCIENIYEAVLAESIAENPSTFVNTSTKTLNDHIDVIMNDIKGNQWAGGQMAHLISLIFDVAIKNYNNNSRRFNNIRASGVVNNKDKNTLYIYYNGRDHYDALIKKKDNKI